MAIYIVEAINNPTEWEVVLHDEFDRPIDALKKWCELEEDYPTCVTIRPATIRDGMDFVKWCYSNWNSVEKTLELFHVPYQLSYLKDSINLQYNHGQCDMVWDGDELSPFSFG